MGIASLGGILSGTGNVSAPTGQGTAGIYSNLLNSYLRSQGNIYNTSARYQPQYAALSANTLASLAPTASATVNSINPSTSLLSSLAQNASEQLGAGANLDPGLENVAQQSLRGAQAARGLGNGPGDAINEAIAMTSLGNQLRQQREQFASGVAGQQFQQQTVPTLSLLSGYGANTTSNLLPAGITSSFLTLPYSAQARANEASAANNTSLYQSMDQNSNSFISGL